MIARTLLALALVAAPSTAQRTFTPAQMEEDLFQLTEKLDAMHGGLLRYATRDEIDEANGEVLWRASEERTAIEFYRSIAELLATIRCGHTRATLPALDDRWVATARGLFPAEVCLIGERLFVVRSLDGSLEPRTEITRIDGRTIPEIRAAAFRLMGGDGFVDSSKERRLERDFAWLYARLVQTEWKQSFRVELVGVDAPLAIAGMAPADFGKAASTRPQRPLMKVTLYPEDDLGMLFVRSFGDPGSGPSFPRQLRSSFTELRESGVSNLALDLRGNGGGNDNYGALLVSYLSPEPFGYFDRIEVTELYEGPGDVVERDGMRLVTAHRGLDVQQPSEPGFRGTVYLLTDGWTFSTAADVATVAHHNGLVTVIGEETGGGYDGNTSGSSESMTLAHSGIGVSVPHWMYTTANIGHAYPGRGVPVDHAPERTVAEVIAGRDLELELVRALIAGNSD